MKTFEWTALLLLLGICLLSSCDPPERSSIKKEPGLYLADSRQLFNEDYRFSIKDEIEYPPVVKEGLIEPDLNVTNRQLFLKRCFWCHECRAEEAFDWDNYGEKDWAPRYVGREWEVPVSRMRDKPNSFLNEQIALRIYSYLRDDTLGLYNEEEDNRGVIRIEVTDEEFEELQRRQKQQFEQMRENRDDTDSAEDSEAEPAPSGDTASA